MSSDVPSFSSKQLIKALLKFGFILKKGGKGSHSKLEDPKSHQAITVPKNEHLGKGLRVRIIKDLETKGIKREELYKLFSVTSLTLIIDKIFRTFR